MSTPLERLRKLAEERRGGGVATLPIGGEDPTQDPLGRLQQSVEERRAARIAALGSIIGPTEPADAGGMFAPELPEGFRRPSASPRDRPTLPEVPQPRVAAAAPPSAPAPSSPTETEAPPELEGPRIPTLEELGAPAPQEMAQDVTGRGDVMDPEKVAERERVRKEQETAEAYAASLPVGERVGNAAMNFFKVFPEMAAGAIETIPILVQTINDLNLDVTMSGVELRGAERAEGARAAEDVLGRVARERFVLGDGPEADTAIEQMLETGGYGSESEAFEVANPIQSTKLFQFGQMIRGWAERQFPTDEKLQQSFFDTVFPQALASLGGFYAASGVGGLVGAGVGMGARGGAMIAGGATGATMGASEMFRDALEHGADERTAQVAAALGGVIGMSEVIPILRALDQVGLQKASAPLRRKIVGALQQGSVGALQEALQEMGADGFYNLIAQQVYDEDRLLSEGLMTAGAAGGASGFLARFLIAMIPGRARPSVGGREAGTDPGGLDPYSVLGVSPDASDADIESAFKRRAHEVHPDKNPDPRAAQVLQTLIEARERIRQERGSTEESRRAGRRTRRPERADATDKGTETLTIGPSPDAEQPVTSPEAAAGEEATPRRTLASRLADIIDPDRVRRTRRAEDAAAAAEARAESAFRDDVTGLPNKAAFQASRERLDADPARSWLMVDLTNFKVINDEGGGWDAGNARLSEVAEILREEAENRGVDPRDVMRPGGDEFGVSHTDEAVLREILEATQERVPDLKIGDITSGVRGGIGGTWAEADAATQAKKGTETGPRHRARPGRRPDAFDPASPAEDAAPETAVTRPESPQEGREAPEATEGASPADAVPVAPNARVMTTRRVGDGTEDAHTVRYEYREDDGRLRKVTVYDDGQTVDNWLTHDTRDDTDVEWSSDVTGSRTPLQLTPEEAQKWIDDEAPDPPAPAAPGGATPLAEETDAPLMRNVGEAGEAPAPAVRPPPPPEGQGPYAIVFPDDGETGEMVEGPFDTLEEAQEFFDAEVGSSTAYIVSEPIERERREREGRPKLPAAEGSAPAEDVSRETDAPAQPDFAQEGDPAPGQAGTLHSDRIVADPDRFQFKQNVDAQGATRILDSVEQWDDAKAGVLLVWRDPADGVFYVANGHHRLKKRKETGGGPLLVRHIVAEDAGEARAIAAATNIAEGRGTAVDAGKFFREEGIGTREEVAALNIPLTESVARNGLALGRLPDGIFQKVATGKIKESTGVAIGESSLDEAGMLALWEQIQGSNKELTNEQIRELARFTAEAGSIDASQETLFGTGTETRSLALEKAEVSAYIRKRIGQEKRLFGFVSRGDRAERIKAAGVGNVDVKAGADLASDAAMAEELYLRLSTRSGPVADALNRGARSLAEGEKPNVAKETAYNEVRGALTEEAGGASGTDRASGAGGTGGLLLEGRPRYLRETGPAPGEVDSDLYDAFERVGDVRVGRVAKYVDAGKWVAVDDRGHPAGPPAETAAAAAGMFREQQVAGERARRSAEARRAAIDAILEGDLSAENLLAVSGRGGTLTTGASEQLLRDMGLKSTQAREIVRRTGSMGETARGAFLFDVRIIARRGLETLGKEEEPPQRDLFVRQPGPTYDADEPWAKQLEDVEDAAVDYYGTTDDFGAAGYILTDGRMLDFSEPGGTGERTLDHRAIEFIYPNEYRPPAHSEGTGFGYMVDFMARGNVRWNYWAGPRGAHMSVDMTRRPTPEQLLQVRKGIGEARRFAGGPPEVAIDVTDDSGHTIAATFIEIGTPGEVMSAIERLLEEAGVGQSEGGTEVRERRPPYAGQPHFYSRLELAIDQFPNERAFVSELVTFLRKKGVTENEIRWVLGTPLEEARRTGKPRRPGMVEKADLLRAIEEGGIRLGEVYRSDNSAARTAYREAADAWNAHSAVWNETLQAFHKAADAIEAGWDMRRAVIDWAIQTERPRRPPDADLLAPVLDEPMRRLGEVADEGMAVREQLEAATANTTEAPRWRQYTIPGLENYTEIIITLEGPIDEEDLDTKQHQAELLRLDIAQLEADPRSDRSGEVMTKYRRRLVQLEIAMQQPKRARLFQQDAHWRGVDNPVVSIRGGIRRDAEGKIGWHVEETQSDWAQAGRRRGFRQPGAVEAAQQRYDELIKQLDEMYQRERDLTPRERSPEYDRVQAEAVAALDRLSEAESANQTGVEETPFRETQDWLGLAARRIVDEAIAAGAEFIVITPGKQQAIRYATAIRQKVDRIEWEKETWNDGSEHVVIRGWKGGSNPDTHLRLNTTLPLNGEGSVGGERVALEDVLGKDMATQVRGSTERHGTFEGDDIVLGAQGFIELYDVLLAGEIRKVLELDAAATGEMALSRRTSRSAAQVQARHFHDYIALTENELGAHDEEDYDFLRAVAAGMDEGLNPQAAFNDALAPTSLTTQHATSLMNLVQEVAEEEELVAGTQDPGIDVVPAVNAAHIEEWLGGYNDRGLPQNERRALMEVQDELEEGATPEAALDAGAAYGDGVVPRERLVELLQKISKFFGLAERVPLIRIPIPPGTAARIQRDGHRIMEQGPDYGRPLKDRLDAVSTRTEELRREVVRLRSEGTSEEHAAAAEAFHRSREELLELSDQHDAAERSRPREAAQSNAFGFDRSARPRPTRGEPRYQEWRAQGHPSFLTGVSSPKVRAFARENPGMGLLVTPNTPALMAHAADYSHLAIDNGVFSEFTGTTPFSRERFLALLDSVVEAGVQDKVLFVVAPDVVGDAAATLERSRPFFPEIRDRGLPVAFAAQDGLEADLDSVPWDEFDVLFIGGTTHWKLGKNADGTRNTDFEKLIAEAHRRGKQVHVGRVNSAQRFQTVTEGMGAATSDGTILRFGVDKNLPRIGRWLSGVLSRDEQLRLFEPRQPYQVREGLERQGNIFGGEETVAGNEQRDMFGTGGQQTLGEAEAEARRTLNDVRPKIEAGTATQAELDRYRDALSLLRRGLGMAAEEVRLRIQKDGLGGAKEEGTGDLFGEPRAGYNPQILYRGHAADDPRLSGRHFHGGLYVTPDRGEALTYGPTLTAFRAPADLRLLDIAGNDVEALFERYMDGTYLTGPHAGKKRRDIWTEADPDSPAWADDGEQRFDLAAFPDADWIDHLKAEGFDGLTYGYIHFYFDPNVLEILPESVREPRPPAPRPVGEQLAMTFGSEAEAKAVNKKMAKIAGPLLNVSIPGLNTTKARAAKVKRGQEAGFAWVDARGKSPIIGETIGPDEEDLLRLFRAFRHPTAEYGHTVVVVPDGKGGRRIHSHRMNGSGSLNASIMDPAYWVEAAAIAKRHGGEVWLIHNHPGGDPEPSPEDRMVTREAIEVVEREGATFAGHMVINHEDGMIIRHGSAMTPVHVPATQAELEADWNYGTPGVMGPEDLFRYLRQLQEDPRRLDLLLLNTQNNIVAYEARPADDIDTIKEWLPGLMWETGSAGIVIGAGDASMMRRAVEFTKATPEIAVIDVIATGPGGGQSARTAGLIEGPENRALMSPVFERSPDYGGLGRFSDAELEALARSYAGQPTYADAHETINAELAHRRAGVERALNEATEAEGNLPVAAAERAIAEIERAIDEGDWEDFPKALDRGTVKVIERQIREAPTSREVATIESRFRLIWDILKVAGGRKKIEGQAYDLYVAASKRKGRLQDDERAARQGREQSVIGKEYQGLKRRLQDNDVDGVPDVIGELMISHLQERINAALTPFQATDLLLEMGTMREMAAGMGKDALAGQFDELEKRAYDHRRQLEGNMDDHLGSPREILSAPVEGVDYDVRDVLKQAVAEPRTQAERIAYVVDALEKGDAARAIQEFTKTTPRWPDVDFGGNIARAKLHPAVARRLAGFFAQAREMARAAARAKGSDSAVLERMARSFGALHYQAKLEAQDGEDNAGGSTVREPRPPYGEASTSGTRPGRTRQAARTGTGPFNLARLGYEFLADDLTNLVRKQGTGGEAFAARAERATRATKRAIGRLSQRVKRTLKRVSVPGRGAGRAAWYLQTIERDGDSGVARWQQVLEGAIPVDQLPKRVREWVEGQWKLQARMAKMAEQAGVLQIRWVTEDDGTMRPVQRPFKGVPGGKIALRMSTPYLVDMYLNPRGPAWETYRRELARLNGWTSEETDARIRELTERKFTRTHAEIPRLIPVHPTHIYVDGRVIPLLETHPYAYTAASVRSFAHRIGFISEFGQSLDPAIDRMEQLRDEAVQAGVDGGDANNLLKALSGIPLEGPVPRVRVGSGAYEFLSAFIQPVASMIRSGMLTRAMVPNLPEPLGNIQAFSGARRMVRAMVDLSPGRYVETVFRLERMGLTSADVASLTYDRDRFVKSISRMWGQGVLRLFGTKPSWEFGEKFAAAAGLRFAEDLMMGHGNAFTRGMDYFTLRAIGYTKAEARRLVTTLPASVESDAKIEQQPPEIREEYIGVAQRFASRLINSTLTLPAEESRAGNSRYWRSWIWFDNYFQMNSRSSTRALKNLHEGLTSKDPALAGAALYQFAKLHAGKTAAGSAAYLLLAFLLGGSFGLAAAGREWEEERGKFLLKAWVYTQFGPIIMSLHRVWEAKRVEDWRLISAPVSIIEETMELAMGAGGYANLSPLEKASRISGRYFSVGRSLPFQEAVAAMGLAEKPNAELDTAIREYWKWRRSHDRRPGRFEAGDTPEDHQEFRKHLQRAVEVMQAPDAAARATEIREHINAALGIEGKGPQNVASSLRSRKLLTRSGMDDESRAELRAYLGAETYGVLEAHDALLDAWASSGRRQRRSTRTRRSRSRTTRE